MVIDSKIFDEDYSDFFDEYIDSFIERLTLSKMNVEKYLECVDKEILLRLKNNKEAFKLLIQKLFTNEVLSEDIIISVANICISQVKVDNELKK